MFVNPHYQNVLSRNGLDSFDALWNAEAEWIEKPNQDRGGWSGVSRISLALPQGGKRGAYLKRQQNYTRPSLRHPFAGETTFARELAIIRRLQQYNIPTLNPIVFGVDEVAGQKRAILMTEELAGYRSLEELMHDGTIQCMPLHEKRQLLIALAQLVRGMHRAGVQHRSLYAKHLFVRKRDGIEVAIIDLEKSRLRLMSLISMVSDLITLNYRTDGWSKTNRLFFYRQYCGGGKLTAWQKLWCRYIASRSNIKRSSLKGDT